MAAKFLEKWPKLLLAVLLFSHTWALSQEQYVVVFVKGSPKLQASKSLIVRGMKLSPKDKIIFSSPLDLIALIAPGKGRFEISAAKAKKENGELMEIVSNAITAASVKASTRGLITNDLEVKKFFAASDAIRSAQPLSYHTNHFILIEEGKYAIPAAVYPQNEENFFYIHYHHKGEEINYPLEYKADSVIINKQLFTVNNAFAAPQEIDKIEIYYYRAQQQEATLIHEFRPLFLNPSEIKEELKLLKTTGAFAPDKRMEAYQQYIETYYNGKIDLEHLRLFALKNGL